MSETGLRRHLAGRVRRGVACASGALTLGVLAGPMVGPSEAQTGTSPMAEPQWERTDFPVRYGGLSAIALEGGATVSVGFGIVDPFRFTPLAASWHGDSWDRQRVRVGRARDVQLTDVDLLSASRGWSVGRGNVDGADVSLAVEWDGSSWKRKPTDALPFGSGLLGVAAVSADDVWAAGQVQPGTRVKPLVAHYDGDEWEPVQLPPLDLGPFTPLTSISAESADRLWAVGIAGLCLTYDGQEWSQVQLPSFGGLPIDGLKVRSFGRDDTWVVGDVSAADGRHPAALHWDGTSWQKVPTPVDDLAQLNDVSLTDDGVVAIGYQQSPQAFYGLELDLDGPAAPLKLPRGNDALFGSATNADGTELWVVGSGAVGTEGKIRPYAAVRR